MTLLALLVGGIVVGALASVVRHRATPWAVATLLLGAAVSIGAYSAWGSYHDAPPWMVFAAGSIYSALALAVGTALGWTGARALRRRAAA